jgi:hypothetical protein
MHRLVLGKFKDANLSTEDRELPHGLHVGKALSRSAKMGETSID